MYTRMLKKSLLSIVTFALLPTIYSCSSETISEEHTPPVSTGESGFIADVMPMEMVGSRSALKLGSDGMDFYWTTGDVLTVFAEGNNEAKQEYTLRDGAGGTRAHFSSNSFSLKKDTRYFALSKTQDTGGPGTNIPDQNNITLDYAEQKQTGNASSDHLGQYDYMVASAICQSQDNVALNFAHLGFTLRIVMKADVNLSDPEKTDFYNTEFQSIEIYDSENGFRQQQRDFKFSAGIIDNNYYPAWPDQTITGNDRFKLTLESEKAGQVGIKPGDDRHDGTVEGTGDNHERLIAYIELPPENFKGKTIGFTLKGKRDDEEVTYYADYEGFDMLMGKVYQVNLSLKPTTDYYVTVKLNQTWQHGNTTDSRGTGDPGTDDQLGLPTNVYYILCVDGKVKNVKHLGDDSKEAKAVNSFTTTDGNWSKSVTGNNNVIYTYTPAKLKFILTDDEKLQTKNLYIIASKTALPTSTFSSITGYSTDGEKVSATNESVIRALKYSIDSKATTNAPLDASQLFMRDLFSTPWNESSFVGKLIDPMQDVTLYHVAAKVDLNWNCETALTPTTHNVTVSGVNSTNLSLFNPTAAGGSGADYTVSTQITEGTKKYGRQVFFLPQYNSYNVTVGSHAYTNSNSVTFNPSTANGFTSWLRWLKNIKNP